MLTKGCVASVPTAVSGCWNNCHPDWSLIMCFNVHIQRAWRAFYKLVFSSDGLSCQRPLQSCNSDLFRAFYGGRMNVDLCPLAEQPVAGRLVPGRLSQSGGQIFMALCPWVYSSACLQTSPAVPTSLGSDVWEVLNEGIWWALVEGSFTSMEPGHVWTDFHAH